MVRRLAAETGFPAVYVKNRPDKDTGVDGSDWVLLTKNPDFLADTGLRDARCEWPLTGPLWTDDFSSIFSVLR